MTSKAPERLPHLRVFVLGAGVSASCGIPVAKDILRCTMLRLLDIGNGKTADEVHRVLRYLYPSFHESLKNYPNIEDFLNFLEMAKQFNTEEFVTSERFSERRIEKVGDIVLKALTDFLWEKMQSKDRLKSLVEFAESQVKLGDVVITFNWDVTLEQALYMDRKEPYFHYNYSRELDQKQVFLLKPHGSIDWFMRKMLSDQGKGEEFSPLDKRLAVFNHFDFKEKPELAKLLPVIVPPLSAKEFKHVALRRTWRAIFRALSQATQLHIIGYSLPREDQFARFVFRRAIRQNFLNTERGKKAPLAIRIVNPDESVWTTFSRLAGGGEASVNMEFKQTLFQDYVSSLND